MFHVTKILYVIFVSPKVTCSGHTQFNYLNNTRQECKTHSSLLHNSLHPLCSLSFSYPEMFLLLLHNDISHTTEILDISYQKLRE